MDASLEASHAFALLAVRPPQPLRALANARGAVALSRPAPAGSVKNVKRLRRAKKYRTRTGGRRTARGIAQLICIYKRTDE